VCQRRAGKLAPAFCFINRYLGLLPHQLELP
jgi:hypothetical protein